MTLWRLIWRRRRLLWRRPKKKWHPWNRRRKRQMLRPLKKLRRPKQRLCWRSCWQAGWVRTRFWKSWNKITQEKMNAVWTNWTPGVHTVFFEGCYIVYNGNKRRTKQMECKNNEFIKNTSYLFIRKISCSLKFETHTFTCIKRFYII